MTLSNRSPKTPRLLLLLFILVILCFSGTALGKKRAATAGKGTRNKVTRNKVSRNKATRPARGRLSARERRSGRRQERLSARNSRRGGRSRMSARERRQQRKLIAREQASSLKALERKLKRPLTKRERVAELRRIEARHRRDLEAARRRAEAARQAAIARQRALEKAMRDEVQTLIARDDTTGEDKDVRRVAVNALGNHIGTVVVMDPMTGRVYSIVNQEWALRRGFKPCSTIKLVTGLAGLGEKVIDPSNTAAVSERYRIDLTDALAYSNNTYFQQVGGRVGFEKFLDYARDLGLGEKTGINTPNEYSGRLPFEKTGFALNRMSSHGDDFEVTAVQLGTLVSAMANGGKLLAPRVPRTPQEEAKFKAKVRHQINIEPDSFQRMVPGMVGAVNYGSGKKAYDPLQTVAGKTGTCIGQGGWLGLFTSYAPLANPRLAVVVITRGPDARGHFPAAVAGRIYRDLNSRFGTPVNLQIATTPGSSANDSKAAELNEEEKEAAEADAAEAKAAAAETDIEGASSAAVAPSANKTAVPNANRTITSRDAAVVKVPVVESPATRNTVKRVLMPIERRIPEIQRADGSKAQTAPKTSSASKPVSPGEERPRRVQPDRP
jgi:penicillin-binding protein 2